LRTFRAKFVAHCLAYHLPQLLLSGKHLKGGKMYGKGGKKQREGDKGCSSVATVSRDGTLGTGDGTDVRGFL
jgi:hypothetical protein